MLALLCFAFRMKAASIFQQMMDDVNAHLTESEKIPVFGLSLNRVKVMRLHRMFFRRSALRKRYYQWWSATVGTGLLALASVVRFSSD
jgi:hypothetical protein